MRNWIIPVWGLGAIILFAVVLFNPNDTPTSVQTEGSRELDILEGIPGRDQAAALIKRAPLAGLAYYNLLFAKLVPCLMRDASRQSTDALAAKQDETDIVTELRSRLERQCVVYTLMENAVTPFVVDIIKSRKSENYFIFTILEPSDEVFTFTEKEFGIFPNFAVCQRFQRALHDLDIPTRKCKMRSMPSRPPSPPLAR
ncbi:MAG: hypothetical protein IID53_13535 [Proteobacteria bacterium]|nr:hypothetical protein [Pseudomonadota bacterium]